MKVVIIEKQNLWRYDHLLPQELLPLFEDSSLIFLGLILEGKGGAVPVGLMILSEKRDDGFTIEWLGIDPEKRGRGYGSYLLDKAFSVSKKSGKKALYAVVRSLPPDEGEEEGDPEGTVGRFLLDSSFLPHSLESEETQDKEDGLIVRLYKAMTDGPALEAERAMRDISARAKAEKMAKEIPTSLTVTEVEYLSGVEV